MTQSPKPHELSQKLFDQAQLTIPGGVDSPVRAFGPVGGTPRFIVRGRGSHIFDADGNDYLDFVCSWGPMILGHAHGSVTQPLREAVQNGTSFGAPTALEIELSRMVVDAVPSVELVRFVSSGTEACMSALRVARGFTKRERVIKFAGGYHGHAEAFLVQAGSGAATLGVPNSAGVPEDYAGLTLVAEYNDLASVESLFKEYPDEIAAIIVEPVAANMGVVAPQPGFLEGLRSLTQQHGSLLIFDEVITGFRVARGGAQELYGIRPDLTCMGKIIGGGMPVGAFGGRRDIMEMVAPLGPVYQAGTLSGNPLAMTAGIHTLKELFKTGIYARLEETSANLEEGLRQAISETETPARVQRVGSLMTLFFHDDEISDYTVAAQSDRDRYSQFFHGMLDRGFYLPPSQFEAWFVSLAHSPEEMEETASEAKAVLGGLR